MSKKVIIPVLTLALMLMLTSAAFAAVNTLSINLTPGGEAEVDGYDYDLSQLSVGLTVPVNNKLELNGEFTSGNIDTNYKDGTRSIRLKGDYRIFDDRKLRLDFAGGIYQRSLDLYDYKINSLFIGIDGRLIVNKQLSVYSGLSIGLLPEEESIRGDGDPDSLYLFHIKFNYLLNPRFGVSLGYNSESFNSEVLYGDSYYKGFNAGVFFRF
jgi:hypothetical protein